MDATIAVSFDDRRDAIRTFNLLWQLNDKLMIGLDDAVLVHCDGRGNLEYDEDFASRLNSRLMNGAIWGVLFSILVVASFIVGVRVIPNLAAICALVAVGGLVGAVSQAPVAAEATAVWRVTCASKSLVAEVVDKMTPGKSAVVGWLDADGLETAIAAFGGCGGELVRSTLPPHEAAKLDSVLRG